MTREEREQIQKGDHGYLTFTFPALREWEVGIGNRSAWNLVWYASLFIEEKEYFSSDFKPGETYRIPVPVGKHSIRYGVEARLYNAQNVSAVPNIFYTSGYHYLSFVIQENEIEIAREQIISATIKKTDPDHKYQTDSKSMALRSSLELTEKVPIDFKFTLEQKMNSKKRPIIIDYVFSVLENDVIELSTKTAGALKPGEILYLFRDKKVVSKVVVTTVFHSKAKAKVITSGVPVLKNMPYGYLR